MVNSWKEKCLSALRAHVARAVADDFRQIARHVTIEREYQTERILPVLPELARLRGHFERKFDELAMVTESLVLEVVRLQRQIAEMSPPAADRLEVYNGEHLQSDHGAPGDRRAA